MKNQSNTGITEIGGVPHMRNSKGHWVRRDTVPARTQLQDEVVRKIVDYAKDLNAEIVRYKARTLADIGALDALLAQEYGVERPEGVRGNRTLTTYDGDLMVSVKIADQFHFGPELQQAKALLDEMVRERADNADELLIALVNQAFDVGKEGKVNPSSLMALRSLEISDPRWAKVCQAIDDSRKTIGSKQYVTVHERRDFADRHKLIPLDLAAVEIGPEAFERRSLRRSVEVAREEVAEAVRHLLAGDMIVGMELLDTALQALGVDGVKPSDMQAWRDLYEPATAA
ncbi:DUF3164 family protein [Niveispirillum cyanobacteriorum]|uniref:Sulfate transporter n=1 Tax=Niveispirillum cyanobacteriorum TaxID=1612173 RepID=A0A2K9NDV9_9PROT|nr:DUF3164 family protein [Niveispirillum cyanobacteriorum]AUN31269.1 sulfate transporter [Niveispirillum cyanobacteriorum]GGE72778.1 hypothetical protein GCM10011317_32520 [Niveispirillum cyanobacteriorum]